MVPSKAGRATWALLIAGLAGCGSPKPNPPADTGARAAALAYLETVIRQDWQSAYDALDPDTRRRFTPEQFALLAKSYRKKIGFEPETSRFRSCEEHGEGAIAHAVLLGRPVGHRRRYNEGVVLRRHAGAWRVVLPPTFGR